MKSAKIILSVLFIFSIFILPNSVHADVAPPPAPMLGGLEPFEYQNTEVQMSYERVEMELRPFYNMEWEEWQNRIFVSAYFLMRNQGAKSETMEAIFPLEDLSCGYHGTGLSYTSYEILQDSFAITIDGIPVNVKNVVTPHPRKISTICEEAHWAAFDVTFPVQRDVLIHITYEMQSLGHDELQNIDYILETGAGWKGPIKQGYIIMKFPYVVGQQNVLSETTSGYQRLYNEVYWSFEDLEPTSDDNIRITIVEPNTWQRIQTLQQELAENPKNPSYWLELAELYEKIALYHGDIERDEYYRGRIVPVFEQGIAANPDSAELYAKYAKYQLMAWSPRLIRQLDEEEAARILSLLNKALAIDSNNGTAKETLSELMSVSPFLTFTPPVTIPPTATSLFTSTPSITPSPTITPLPSETPVVVTVVHTKIVKEPAFTSTPRPTTSTAEITMTSDQDESRSTSPVPIVILGMITTLVAGFVIGSVWSRKKSTNRTK